MKVSYELKQGYIDIWNEESEEWDRYIKVNKKSVVEEEKKIPEKIEYYDDSIAWVIDDVGQLSDVDKVIIDKLNDVIDYLKSKGE